MAGSASQAATEQGPDGFAFGGEMLDCDGHLYMEPDVMAGIVGDAGASWVIEHLRGYVGTEADRAERVRARTETWSVQVVSALRSCRAGARGTRLCKSGVA